MQEPEFILFMGIKETVALISQSEAEQFLFSKKEKSKEIPKLLSLASKKLQILLLHLYMITPKLRHDAQCIGKGNIH